MFEFRLPSLGAEMDEGTLVAWKVKPGDRVKKGDVVAVVDTSKSAIDVEIWQEGTVLDLAAEVGEKIPVGTVIARLAEPGEIGAPPGAATTAAPAPIPEARRAPTAATAPAPRFEGQAAAPPVAAPTRRRVSPAARVHAEELGVDLEAMTGTGPQGAVTLEDVVAAGRSAPARAPQPPPPPAVAPAREAPPRAEAVAEAGAAASVAMPAPAPRPAAGPPAGDRGSAMRAAIGAAMARSKREIPHYYLAADVPMARATDWLAARNASRPVTGRVLMAAPLLKAVALALRKYPELNGWFRDGAFVPGPGVHLGVAISLRQGGLIAPAIHDVDALSIDALMAKLADLVARARSLSLRSSEMSDATITVTNLGDGGVEVVHGVIYPPQVALVGFGRVAERPVVADGCVVAGPVVTASLAADHRASDGHRGALFLAEVARLLQQPESLEGTPR